jgi:prefoldin beta subunit
MRIQFFYTFSCVINSFYVETQEMDMLDSETKVYKLVGPVLMSVELEESKGNVAKRLEFIETEIKRVDTAIAAKQGELALLGDEIAKEQQKMAASAAQAAREIAAGAV